LPQILELGVVVVGVEEEKKEQRPRTALGDYSERAP
jgi:hypothetical protein